LETAVSVLNPKRQNSTLKVLDKLFEDAANVWVIHYSCESFYNRTEGRSPRITSIALRKLDTAQSISFSIHQTAERNCVSFGQIEGEYDNLEKEMLTEFFEHLASRQGMKYLHWNMRDANYGFQAIEHRFKVLGENPHVVDDNNKIDLSRMLIDIYGRGYICHPRMEKLLERNDIATRDFLTGEEEAKAFEEHNYAALHQSTLRKIDVIANIASQAHDRDLTTNTTWWEMRGGRFRTSVNFVIEHKAAAFLASLVTIVGGVIAVLYAQ
jgi:hypothetical protein